MAKSALCIGINNYPGTDCDLRGCVNDANDWAATLAARGFTVKTLLDNQATK
ncbi:MAG: caspase family protein, partial [Cyanobacteriota bacterium]